MGSYLTGVSYGLGSVAAFYAILRWGLQTKIGLVLYFAVYSLFHDFSQPLHATAGGSPWLFGHLWFWLWSMILFAGTFLIYLGLKHA
jgi:hypothetical protein